MLLRLKKELRAARLPWVCSLIGVAYIPLHHLVFFTGGAEAPFLTGLAYGLGGTSLTFALAQVFSSEFQQGTLTFLLAQPTTRTRLWLEKFAAQLIIAGSVFLVLCVVLLAGWGESSDALGPDEIGYAAVCIMLLVASISLWTTIGRSSIAGAALTWFAICIGGLVFKALFSFLLLRTATPTAPDLGARIQNIERLWPPIVLAVAAIYALCTAYLGWFKFVRFGLSPGVNGAAGSSQPGQVGASVLPYWLRPEPNRNFVNLLRKEFCLQQPVIKIAFLYLICWLVGFGLSKLPARGSEHFLDFCDMLTVFYSPLAVILAGALSLTEEKTLGIYEWQLTLPVSAAKQWLTRAGVSAAAGLLLGCALPCLLILSFRTKTPDLDVHSFLAFGGVALAAWTGTFWAATFTTSTVRAAIGGLVTAFGGSLCFAAAVILVNLDSTDPFFKWAFSSRHFGLFWLMSFCVGVGYFLLQSYKLMQKSRPRMATICISAIGGALLIFVLSWVLSSGLINSSSNPG